MSQYLIGEEALRKKLDGLKKTDAKAALRKGTRAGCKVIQKRGQELAPKRTKRLARNIRVRALPRSKKWVGTMVRGTNYKGDEFYGAFQEFGWRHGPRKLGDKRKKIEGKHFMERAVKEVGPQAIDVARAETVAEIERRTRL